MGSDERQATGPGESAQAVASVAAAIWRRSFAGWLAGVLLVIGCSSGEPAAQRENLRDPVETSARTAGTVGAVERGESDEGEGYPINLLAGRPLDEPTGLRVVTNEVIIDIDNATETPIDGLASCSPPLGASWAFEAAGQTFVSTDCLDGDSPKVFAVDLESGSASLIGSGSAAPAPDGVWLTTVESDTVCSATKVDPNGDELTPSAAIDCDLWIVEESNAGLLARRTNLARDNGALLDADDLTVVHELPALIGTLDDFVVAWDGDQFSLIDPTEPNSPRATFEAPTDIGSPGAGYASPDAETIAIPFAHPAWPGPRQRLDVWLLDVENGWHRMPNMPVAASLKATSYEWLPDGRFVFFGAFDEVGTAIAQWNPGDPWLEVLSVSHNPSALADISIIDAN